MHRSAGRFVVAVSAFALLLPLFGCGSGAVSQEEAREAVAESTVSSQAQSLTSASIEVGTNFTLGQAAEKAASELKGFIGTALPCADVSLSGAALSVNYGAKAGNCTWHGHTFSGATVVTVTKADSGDVVVQHTWKALSNGLVTVDGNATVTWSVANGTRHVVHNATWKRLSDGHTGSGSGDRTQTALTSGDGFRIDGTRSWDGPSGHWDLSIQGVEIRWSDPAPQAGTYVLGTPKDKSVTLTFARETDTTILVDLESGKKSFKFTVHEAAGDVDDAG